MKLLKCCGRTLELGVSRELSSYGPFLAVTAVCSLRWCGREPEGFDSIIESVTSKLGSSDLREHPLIKPYRKFMWRIGIDPTKVRPSHEALLRRLLFRREFPRINTVVDAGNLASIEAMIPIGLYNMELLKPPLLLRRARSGEVFEPIGGKLRKLQGNEIVLSDAEKILHIFPYRDSQKTMIVEGIRDVLVVAAGVPGVPEEDVVKAAVLARKYIARSACGEECGDVQLVTS